MVLVQKVAIFPTFFLGNLGQEKVFYDILEEKNAFLGYKKKKFNKSKNRDFSSGVNTLFWSKTGNFSNFFLRQYRQGKCVLRYSITKKNAFLPYKHKKLKKSKN